MLAELARYIAGVLLLIGTAFSFLAAVGILRLPDLYTRMHAASKAGTMGSGLMLVAIAIASMDGSVALRAFVGVVFLILTGPVSAHLLARAAYLAGYKPTELTTINDLEAHRKDKK